MKVIYALLVSILTIYSPHVFAESIAEILGDIPVQDAGRKKPFDTFARETLQLIYGKRDYKKISFPDQPQQEGVKNSEISATETLLTWLLVPEVWDQTRFIKVDRFDLKETLKLEKTRGHFSPAEIMATERLMLLFQDLQGLRTAQTKLNPYWQAVQSLENSLSLYKGVVAGAVIKLAPKPAELNDTAWYELRELPPELRAKFDRIAEEFARALALMRPQSAEAGAVTASEAEITKGLRAAVDDFVASAKAINPAEYPDTLIAFRVV